MEKPEQNVQSVLCMACLCLDRSLNELQNVKLKQYYLDTLGEIPLCNKTLISPIVCWECEALLKKVLSFREQVKDSYRILQTYAHENLYECLLNDVARPPRLKVHINKPVDISPDISSDNEEEESIKAEVKTEVNEATHLMKNRVKLNAQHNINEQAQVLSDTKQVKKKVKKKLKSITTSRENSKPPRLKKLNNSTEICSLAVNGDKPVILDIKFEEKDCKEERINSDVDCPNNTDSDPILDTSDNSSTTMEREVNSLLINKKNTTKAMVKNKLKNAKKIVKRVHSSQKRNKHTDSCEISKPPRLKGSFNNSTDTSPLGENDYKPVILDVKFEEKDYKEERINSDVDCPDNTDDDPILATSDNCNTAIAIGQEVENILEMKNITTKTMVKNKLKNAKKIVKRLHSSQKTKQLEKESQNEKILTIELTYDEMLQERERESKRDSYTKAQYKCETCLIGFHYNKSYKAHLVAKHSPDIGDYSCPICKTIISSVESFTAHYKRHMRRYECSICRKRTIDVKAMQQHYYSTHEISLKEYKCNLCGKISNSIDTHRYHKDTHKARVQCDECDKTFSHRAGLMNHRLSVHEFQNAFPCTVCNKVFRWKTSLKRHLEKHDIKSNASKSLAAGGAFCAECDVGFASLCSLQRHLRNSLKHVTPDQLKFICDHCNRRFADKTKLRDHIEGKHLHRTYQCHICHKTSKNRVGLEQHVRNVHKGRPNNKMCHHCGKGFPTKVQLESHIRTHTGERPFICEYCPTTFSQQSNLYKHHRQVHLNIKSKRYPLCTKKKMIEGSRTDNPLQSEHPIVTGTYSVYYA